MLLGIVIVTLAQLRRVRDAIRRAVSNRGFESATRPSVFAQPRVRSWLVGHRVPSELAAEIDVD